MRRQITSVSSMIFVLFGKGRMMRAAHSSSIRGSREMRKFEDADEAAAFVEACEALGFNAATAQVQRSNPTPNTI
jgi:hypothetical protein